MLRVVQVASPFEKHSYLDKIDVHRDSWIVSDLQSREEMQNRLKKQHGYLEAFTVLRASELWNQIVKRGFPELRLVGRHLSRMLLSDFLKEHQQYSSIQAASTLSSYISQLMPLLSHPEGSEMMEEWFKDHPESSMRWRSWFELSKEAYSYFKKQNVISKTWASAFLINDWNMGCTWERTCYFDLGLEIHQIEAELLRHMSTITDVVVFEPVKVKGADSDYSDRVYDMIRGFASEVTTCEPEAGLPAGQAYLRMATPLAEVKEVVSQARSLIEQGCAAERIAILAPKIEDYWFCLRSYMDKEGLSFRRSSTERFSSLLGVQQWLADLRVRTGSLASADLEMSYYGRASDKALSFEIFRSLFTSVYDESHLDRDDDVKRFFANPLADKEFLSRDEFVAFAISYWAGALDFTPAKSLLQVLVGECGPERSFRGEEWVEYISALASEQEIRTEKSAGAGVYCGDLRSIENVEVDHIFFMGLDAQGMNRGTAKQVLAGDVEAIASDLGFFLNHPEQDHVEGLVRWMSECSPSHQTYLFPMTDFSGVELSPSKFWIKGALLKKSDIHSVASPKPTRWDELQKYGLKGTELETLIAYDLGSLERPNFAEGLDIPLSASSVESYLKCPFIFAAQKVFRLSDEPIADVDFEARGKGQVTHKFFEYLLEPPIRFERTKQELRDLLDRIAEEEGLTKIEKKFWGSLRERLVLLGERFLEKEKARKAQFPGTSTVGRELDFELFFDPQTKEISKASSPGAVKFRGQIDRLDTDEKGAAVVYDYKSSKSSKMTHAQRWVETQQIQLSLYVLAVESEATGAGAQEVIGAFYYIIKDLGDYHGFRISEEAGRLFDLSDRRRNQISKADKEKILSGIKDILSDAILRMRSGQFQPHPADEKLCETCPWSRTCRAPHLH